MQIIVQNNTKGPAGFYEVGKDRPTVIPVGESATLLLPDHDLPHLKSRARRGEIGLTGLVLSPKPAAPAAPAPPPETMDLADLPDHRRAAGEPVDLTQGADASTTSEAAPDNAEPVDLGEGDGQQAELTEEQRAAAKAAAEAAEGGAPAIDLDSFDDEQLHVFIESLTKRRLPSNTKRETLLARAKDLLTD